MTSQHSASDRAPSSQLKFPRTSARVTTLDNGLEVIIKEDHSAPVVSLQAWCRAGSIHESEWLGAGMSHFLEHMLFKGTKERSASDVAKEVQANGGGINAYTSFDRTVYYIDSPSAGHESCLDILCDVIRNAQIPKEEFEREQEVIRREFAMVGDDPGREITKMLFRNAYTTHPCRHPVIGHIDLFDQLSRDDLYDYYREKYSPDNLFFVIVGAVDTEQTLQILEDRMGSMKRRRKAEPVLSDEPIQMGSREEVLEFPTELSRSRIAWQVPDQTHHDVAALDLLSSILGGGRSSRLYQAIREEKELAHSVSAFAYTPEYRGLFILSIDAEPDNMEVAETAALAEVERLKTDGITQDELVRVRNQSLSAQFSTLTDVSGQASDLGSNWLNTRNLDYTRDYVETVQAVSVEDIQRVAQTYLDQGNRTRVALVPPREQASTLARTSPSQRSENIRHLELDNGLTVLLLADHRVPFVQASSSFRGGRLVETDANAGISRLMGRLLSKDTKKRSAIELSNAIETAGGGISAVVGNNTFGVSVGALKTDLDLVVDMLGQAVQAPLFLDEVVEKEKQFQLSALKAESDHPFTVAMSRFKKELFGDHPYGLPGRGTESSIQSFSSTDLVDFRDQLVMGQNGVVGVFGDLDLAEAEDKIRAQFDSIASGKRMFEKGTGFDLPKKYGQIAEEKHEKEQAILLIGYRTCDLQSEDNMPIGLIDEACSDMASRMFIRIREELGLAYSVGAMRMLGYDTGYLAFYVATAPDQLDLVQEEVIGEIDKMARNGLEQDEFDRAKASWLGGEVINLQGVRELAGLATVDELVGLGWDNYRKTPERIEALTMGGVKQVAEKYLRDENRVIVRLTT